MSKLQIFWTGYMIGYAVNEAFDGEWRGAVAIAALALIYVLVPLAIRGLRVTP